jgi:hypothetical protein
MIETDAPSTGGVAGTDWHDVRVPPGVVMVSPPTPQRNASRAQSEGRANENRYEKKRGQGHYRGQGPTT